MAPRTRVLLLKEDDVSAARFGLGRIVALHHHSPTSYRIRERIQCLCS